MKVNRLAWASSGHEREYCLNFEKFGHDNYIPEYLARKITEALPGYYVLNRGSRIEIMPPRGSYVDESRSILPDTMHKHVQDTIEALMNTDKDFHALLTDGEPSDGVLTLLVDINELIPVPPRRRTCPKQPCAVEGTMKELISHMRTAHTS